MNVLKIRLAFKRLRWLLSAFLIGWFSAKMSSQFSSIKGQVKQVELLAVPITQASVLSLSPHSLTEERPSCHNAERNRSVNTVLYRELLRRRSIKTVSYVRSVIVANLKRMKGISDSTRDVERLSMQLKPLISSTEKLLKQSTSYLLANLHEIEVLDDMNICRKEALNRLSNLVQARVKALQNPSDCTRAKILLADVSWPCGYGCHTHYLMFCLNNAYATGRTLILQSLKTDCGIWWSESYMSFSDKCSMNSVSRDDVIIGK
ncbi:unnamed protein product [Calicophoron daubneyi]|uniref:Alpha-(1,6)-fucosyltransferase N- and catalytic domain-containing protein n=1 Tax=Calicophoron daubneyi TaxID=300641 RepID=A0AAV2TIT3_CALDB